MPKNDEGDFELVLGNKQLLSVFFIVVVLLGVFFTMGYIVGRNTSPDALTEMAAAGQPLVVEQGSSGGLTATVAPPSGGEAAPAAAPPKPPAAAPSKAKPKPVEPPKPAPAAARKPSPPKPSPPPKATPPPPRAAGAGQPSAGQTFLQVVATSRAESETVRDVLQGKGFTVRLAPVPGQQDLFRVLVGPVEGAEALSKTRAGLQAAGFKPFTRRY